MLAMLGALQDPALARAAHLELEDMLVADSTGAAFTRSGSNSGVTLVAVDRACDVAVSDLLRIANWVASLFDVARTVDPKMFAAHAAWPGRAALVTWQSATTSFVAFCSSRGAAARLLGRLSSPTATQHGRDALTSDDRSTE
jgi:hypothetical protein